MKNKYVLICSDESEGSTDLVCDWLNHFDKPFIRVSALDLIKIENVKIFNNEIDIEFSVNNEKYFLSEIRSYWYRRSSLSFSTIYKVNKKIEDEDVSKGLNFCLSKEYEVLIEYFEKKLDEKSILNKNSDNKINKLEVLSLASNLGILIPDTLVTQNKKDLDQFYESNIVTKAIGNFMFLEEKYSFGMMTNKISKTNIEEDVFFHTLFQDQIDKLFELRIFFVGNDYYSSAIFSQSNDQTKVDFRNYDYDYPNRVVPYLLPDELKHKLSLLMEKLDLKSGSIDMAYTKQGEYVFFEVNPIGQFEQVTFPCNYNLFKEIAILL